ncbi:MAG: co-chaperone GroES [Marinilabiliales bacterium]|nr:MAG: co-chaperone GroES [Marinilabiliales bacterium]
MRELTPINQHVVLDITEEKKEKQTSSGIIIPDTVSQKEKFAKVVAVSNIDDSEISVGDTVFFKEYAGTEVELDDKKYLVIPYAEILAKIVETEEI